MIIDVSEAKQYLRVDTADDDALIEQLIQTGEELCKSVSRLDDTAFVDASLTTRTAVLYAVAYLYEHREEADHEKLMLTLRALLSGVREAKF